MVIYRVGTTWEIQIAGSKGGPKNANNPAPVTLDDLSNDTVKGIIVATLGAWRVWAASGDLQVGCGSLAAFHFDFVADLLAFIEAPKPGCLDRGDMDENVLAAILRHNEAKAFGGVEPLNSTDSHSCVTLSVVGIAQQRAILQTTGPLDVS
jgi:hypothetical protein